MKRASRLERLAEGPFYADMLRDGDGYELSRGHAILCEPSGKDHSRPHLVGSLPLATDPAVHDGGVEAGHKLDAKTLRAPDISIGELGGGEGTWSTVAPPLAVEYASRGQDEADLRRKIDEFLAAGTRLVWVVRLTGPRRVEVHRRGRRVQIKRPGERLEAPGLLKNAPLVEALYDPEVSREHALQNLLERKGYAGLDAVLREGETRGREAGLREGETRGREAGLREGETRGREAGLREGETRGRKAGLREGTARGKAEGLRRGVEALCDVLGVAITPARRTRLDGMRAAELEALVEALRRSKRWPAR
jgi:Uma2 family endonuclease